MRTFQSGFGRRFVFALHSLGLLFLSSFSLQAGDVLSLEVLKAQFFVQSDSGVPVALASNGFLFHAGANLCTSFAASGGTVQLPGGAVTNLGLDGDALTFNAQFNSLAALNAAYLSGNYLLSIQTVHFGTNAAAVLLSGDAYPANAPHLTNFAAAQAINPSQDFKLGWDAFTGATTNDFVRVEVQDALGYTVFETGLARGQANFLNGTNNSVIIPGDTLSLGQTYDLRLFFGKITATNATNIAGAVVAAGYVKLTMLSIKTTDVTAFGAVKGQSFNQTSTATPASAGFGFRAFVETDSANTLNSATVLLPTGGAPQTLPDTNNFSLEADFASQAALDSAYPNGNYTMTLDTVHDGTRTAILNTSGNAYPGTTPRVSNFTAAQAINSGADFRLTWDPWVGGTSNDFVQVQISDSTPGGGTFYESGQPGGHGALNGTNTSFVIPGGTLFSGGAYDVSVLFARINRTNSYTNVVGFGGYFKSTDCPIKTTDGNYCGVVKGQLYLQSSPATPVLQEFDLQAFAQSDNIDTWTDATLKLPNNSTQPLFSADGQSFEFDDGPFASQADLDTAYPNGSYTMTLTGIDDGIKTIVLPVTGNTYPSTPHLSNFTAAQAIDACADFVLTWDAFTGGTTNDFVQVQVVQRGGSNSLFQTGQFIGQARALNGTNTSVHIPGDTLLPGRSYDAQLLFARGLVNSNSYPGVLGIGGFFKRTQFTLASIGTPVVPRLDITADFVFFDQVYIHLSGEVNQSYVIEYKDNLEDPIWQFLGSSTAYDGTIDAVDYGPFDATTHRFYQAHEGP